MVRQRFLQRVHEGRRRSCLADRNGVHPDDGAFGREAVMAKTLSDSTAVARLAPSAPPQPREDERRGGAQQQAVERPQPTSFNTWRTSGGRPAPPTFFARGAPYRPVSTTSEPQ